MSCGIIADDDLGNVLSDDPGHEIIFMSTIQWSKLSYFDESFFIQEGYLMYQYKCITQLWRNREQCAWCATDTRTPSFLSENNEHWIVELEEQRMAVATGVSGPGQIQCRFPQYLLNFRRKVSDKRCSVWRSDFYWSKCHLEFVYSSVSVPQPQCCNLLSLFVWNFFHE